MIFINDFMLTLIDLSKTGIFVILGVLVVRYFLRNAPKKYSYYLWLAVCIRLLCPFSIESIFSVFNVEKGITPFVSNDNIISDVITYVQPFYYGNRINECHIASLNSDAYPIDTFLFNYFCLWLVVVFFMTMLVCFSYCDVHNLTKYAIRLKDNIYQGEKIKAPFVFGFFRPKIYIPYGLDEQTQDIILEHESYHIKRKDHIFRLIGILILTIYWFNPFVWLAYKLFIEDMEMSCDEYVLLNQDNKTYSSTLLSFAFNQFSKPKPLAFGESAISKRIKNSLRWKTPNKKTVLLSLCLSLFVLVSFTSGPTKQENLNSLLKRYSINEIQKIDMKRYDAHYEMELDSWLHLYKLEHLFDYVKISKFSIEPSMDEIVASYTVTNKNNDEITIQFTEGFNECIVKDGKNTSYKILNPDVAQGILIKPRDILGYSAMWYLTENMVEFSRIYITEQHEYLDSSCDEFANLRIGEGHTLYNADCDFILEEEKITLISQEDPSIFVFDITMKNNETYLKFNALESKVESEELLEILNKIEYEREF